MSQSMEVQVPDIGDFAEVEVIEILVKPGDTIAVEQSLITVESDKASMEIPSAAAGVVRELRVKLGDKVAKGSVILTVEAADSAAAAAAPAPAAAPAAVAPAPAAVASAPVASPPTPSAAPALPVAAPVAAVAVAAKANANKPPQRTRSEIVATLFSTFRSGYTT